MLLISSKRKFRALRLEKRSRNMTVNNPTIRPMKATDLKEVAVLYAKSLALIWLHLMKTSFLFLGIKNWALK